MVAQTEFIKRVMGSLKSHQEVSRSGQEWGRPDHVGPCTTGEDTGCPAFTMASQPQAPSQHNSHPSSHEDPPQSQFVTQALIGWALNTCLSPTCSGSSEGKHLTFWLLSWEEDCLHLQNWEFPKHRKGILLQGRRKISHYNQTSPLPRSSSSLPPCCHSIRTPLSSIKHVTQWPPS